VQIRGEELTGTVKELKQKARDHAMTHFRGQTVIAPAFTEQGSVCVKTKDAP
jgi:prophage tail gpP-like protein